MSIFPAIDLVSEVAQSADPTRRSAAIARLNEISPLSPRSVKGFADLVADNPNTRRSVGSSPSRVAVVNGYGTPAARPLRPGDATQRFEAFIIQSCLESILPKSEDGIFGRGTAGGVWRSMIAEQIGEQIAKAGGFGLHRVLDRKGEADFETTKNVANPSAESS